MRTMFGRGLWRGALAAVWVFAAAGTASAQRFIPELPANAAGSAGATVVSRQPTDMEYYATPLEGTQFGSSGARGNLGVGVMFGAIGAASNAIYVANTNRSRAAPLAEVATTDLSVILRGIVEPPAPAPVVAEAPPADGVQTIAAEGSAEQAAPAETVAAPVEAVVEPPAAPAGPHYELLATAQFEFTSDTSFHVRCAVTATFPTGGRRPWRARYSVHTRDVLDTTSADVNAQARERLEPCLRQAYALFQSHVDRQISLGERVRFRAGGFAQRLPEVAPRGENMVVADVAGLTQYPVDQVNFE